MLLYKKMVAVCFVFKVQLQGCRDWVGLEKPAKEFHLPLGKVPMGSVSLEGHCVFGLGVLAKDQNHPTAVNNEKK